MSDLESAQNNVNPISIYEAHSKFQTALATKLSSELFDLLSKTKPSLHLSWPNGVGEREITSIAWKWLAKADESSIHKQALNAVKSDSMALAQSALEALNPIKCQERLEALEIFYERWENNPIILDSWFRLQASNPNAKGLEND